MRNIVRNEQTERVHQEGRNVLQEWQNKTVPFWLESLYYVLCTKLDDTAMTSSDNELCDDAIKSVFVALSRAAQLISGTIFLALPITFLLALCVTKIQGSTIWNDGAVANLVLCGCYGQMK
jgi:hypothetical protein